MNEQWQCNLKDGRGWQAIDAEAVALEINDAAELSVDYDTDGDVCAIDTGHAKYRKVKRSTAPLATVDKVVIEDDGNCLWAIT